MVAFARDLDAWSDMAAFPGSDAALCRLINLCFGRRSPRILAVAVPAPGLQPLDQLLLRRLDPAHRELVLLLRKLYDAQTRLYGKPRTGTDIARSMKMTKPRLSRLMSGKELPTYPDQVRKLAQMLGGSDRELARAANLCGEIDRSTTPRWWMAGTDARSHFDGRATGRRPGDGRGGDTFTGRMRALKRVREWLQSSEGPGFPLVVTGQAGAGECSNTGPAKDG